MNQLVPRTSRSSASPKSVPWRFFPPLGREVSRRGAHVVSIWASFSLNISREASARVVGAPISWGLVHSEATRRSARWPVRRTVTELRSSSRGPRSLSRLLTTLSWPDEEYPRLRGALALVEDVAARRLMAAMVASKASTGWAMWIAAPRLIGTTLLAASLVTQVATGRPPLKSGQAALGPTKPEGASVGLWGRYLGGRL